MNLSAAKAVKKLNLEEKIWKDKKKGLLNPVAFSDEASELARIIAGESKKANKQTQIRRFYDTILHLNQKTKSADSENAWNAIEVQLYRQIAFVHYAKGRKLVTDTFVNMMEELIRAVKCPEDLQVITDFLEAFMAFYRELRRD